MSLSSVVILNSIENKLLIILINILAYLNITIIFFLFIFIFNINKLINLNSLSKILNFKKFNAMLITLFFMVAGTPPFLNFFSKILLFFLVLNTKSFFFIFLFFFFNYYILVFYYNNFKSLSFSNYGLIFKSSNYLSIIKMYNLEFFLVLLFINILFFNFLLDFFVSIKYLLLLI